MKKFFLIAAGIVVLAFLLLSSLGNQQIAKQQALPEKSKAMSAEIFGAGLPPIEQAKHFGMQYHFLLTGQHLDYPVKLRKFSEQFCALETKSHCYLLFYTDRAALPQAGGDMSDSVNPLAFFTINKTTGVNEISYNMENAGYSDQSGDLQKYFADHGKAWQ